jgi:Asp-tRNA(Asn)/Glu-tRNA(Gln) amidotransferase A subunit family amidase
VNITIPHLREIHLSHGIKILTEFGIQWETEFFNHTYCMEPNTAVTVALGRAITATEILAAEKVRSYAIRLLRHDIFHEQRLDAIVSPTIGDKVPKLPRGFKGYGESNTAKVYKIMRFVPLANFLGLPGLSVPVGYESQTGLPIGFHFLGDAWSEPTLIRLGLSLRDFHQHRPPLSNNFFDMLGPWISR